MPLAPVPTPSSSQSRWCTRHPLVWCGAVSQKQLQALAERWGYNSGSVCNQVCATGLCCENGGVSPWLNSATFFALAPMCGSPRAAAAPPFAAAGRLNSWHAQAGS